MKKIIHYSFIEIAVFLLFTFVSCQQVNKNSVTESVRKYEKDRIEKLVDLYWNLEPITVTNASCERSAGSKHDFYSEGDYWWPDTVSSELPYIRKDGLSNPANFKAHRRAMVRLSKITGALTSAYILTKDEKYAHKAMDHLRAWFIAEDTRMNPNLLYSQAIKGRYTGRGIGIIDGIHLIEVARSVFLLQDVQGVSSQEIDRIKEWFAQFLNWMVTHEYGKKEMIHPNNHGTCWTMQAAAYAQLTANDSILAFCSSKYKDDLLPNQMSVDGSFPLELERTKPYGYSIFNLDVMSLLVQVLSLSGEENYWDFQTADGRGMKKGIEFLYPYLKNKNDWTYGHDVLYWDNWPVRQTSLVLSGIAYNRSEYIDLWKTLESDPVLEEVQRNLVMRYPLLWLDNENN